MSEILEEPWAEGLRVSFVLDEVIARRKTPHQSLMVAITETYGRALFIDGLVQSTESDEALYHEPLVHPALIIHGAARRVLVGGTGEGASLRELLKHPTIEVIESVDIDRGVVELCREHLPAWSDGALDDPRVRLRYEDIAVTLARPPTEPWDVVILDVTDPVEEGPAVDLFTTEFFAKAAEHLADDGLLVLQSGELDLHDLGAARTVQSTLGAVFPWVAPMVVHVPSFHCMWSITLAAKRPHDLCPSDLEQRVARLPADALHNYSAESHRTLVSVPSWLRRGLATPGRVLTGADDERLITFPKGEA